MHTDEWEVLVCKGVSMQNIRQPGFSASTEAKVMAVIGVR